MAWNVIGLEYVDYVSKKTKSEVHGKKVHASREIEKGGEGFEVETFYISSRNDAYVLIGIGDAIKPVYNKFGFLEDLILV